MAALDKKVYSGKQFEAYVSLQSDALGTNDVSGTLYKIRIPEVNDLRTEALYFISLLDSQKVKEEWIIDLQNNQNKDGTFGKVNKDWPKKNQEIMKAHHVALALLALHNFYNGVIETNY